MTQIKVSIIIPVFNVAEYVENCLLSVFNQSYNNIETIIIDDCGTDKSMEIVNDFIINHKNMNIKIIKHEKNKGLSAARNTGLKESSGDYIFFLDSDDSINNNSIELLVAKVLKYNFPDIVLGRFNIINNSTSLCLDLKSKEFINNKNEIFLDYITYKWDVTACNKLLKKEFLLQNNISFIEGIYHEDNDFSFKLAINASTMASCSDFTYNYYIRTNSITTNKKLKNYSDYLSILINNIREVNKTNYIYQYKEICSEYIINLEYSFCFYLIKDISKNISFKDKEKLIKILQSNLKELNHLVVIRKTNFKIKRTVIFLPIKIMYFVLKLFILIKYNNTK